MNTQPSPDWLQVFPGPRIPDILAYVVETWDWLRQTYGAVVTFQRPEPELTDNLCEALNDRDRRYAHSIDCDFQSETWELRRDSNGRTKRVARADIRVILGAPGTPHLVMEFKKLDGTTGARRHYCFDGMIRFLDGKYAIGHAYGVMCGLTCVDVNAEVKAVCDHIAQPGVAQKLNCIADCMGKVTTFPSATDPVWAKFDTRHNRPKLNPPSSIVLLHVLVVCDS